VNDAAGVELIRNGRVIVARMPVEVEITQTPVLRGQLIQAVENRDLGLVIDLTATEYLDSSGVNMLFELGEGLAARQLRMAVVMPRGGLVERVVSIVDLGSAMPIYRDIESAVDEIRNTPGAPSD
jgi:anti-sigma B factor antagonist